MDKSLRALLIVDVQNDFCEGGALATEGGAAVAAAITEHMKTTDYDFIVASRDWHQSWNDNGGHFATDAMPDYDETWPVHCVAGTDGADYHTALDWHQVDAHIYKGVGRPDYSAFQGAALDGETLESVLYLYGNLDVVGIATDYCVKASALDAVRLGFTNVRVLAHLTSAVTPETRDIAIAEMREAGVEVVDQ